MATAVAPTSTTGHESSSIVINTTLHLGGGTGGAGGQAEQQGGKGGSGEGAQFQPTYNFSQTLPSAGSSPVKAPIYKGCPPPTKFFQGRIDVLHQLENYFGTTSLQKQIVVLLHGLAGVGKTEAALHFIQDHSSRFTDTFKITADNIENIEAGYREIAGAKKLQKTMEEGQNWLKGSTEEWIVLFDNADDPHLDLNQYLPQCSHGNILITSRNPGLYLHTGPENRSIQLQDLQLDEAYTLLKQLSQADMTKNNNDSYCREIAEELSCFPLAIVHAGAFIGHLPLLREQMSQYQTVYRKNNTEVLGRQLPQSVGASVLPVYTTWNMNFQQLSLEAQEFLCLCSFIHFTGIKIEIFQRAAEYIHEIGYLWQTREPLALLLGQAFLAKFNDTNKQWDAIKFQHMLAQLCAYSLLHIVGDTYSIHPLVHGWCRSMIPKLYEKTSPVFWFLKAVMNFFGGTSFYNTSELAESKIKNTIIGILGMAMPKDNPDIVLAGHDQMPFQLLLFPHLNAINNDEAFIMCGFGQPCIQVYITAGQYGKAEEVALKTLERATAHDAVNRKIIILAIQADLAITQYHLSRYKEAEGLQLEILTKRKILLGNNAMQTLRAMIDLAATYSIQNANAHAENLVKEVVTELCNRFGEDNIQTIRAKASLANIYLLQHQLRRAQNLTEKIYQSLEKLCGIDHLDTINASAKLASIFFEQSEYKRAREVQEKVFSQMAKKLGPDHPQTIEIQSKLSVTYQALGNYERAMQLGEQVLESRRTLLGSHHLHTIRICSNLAVIYGELGQHDKAENLVKEVVLLLRKAFGEEHPYTLSAMVNLAATYTEQGKDDLALELEEKVLEILEQSTFDDSPELLVARGNLAETYQKLGRYNEAAKLQKQVLKIRTISLDLGPKHHDTLMAKANLAENYFHQGRLHKAETMEQETLDDLMELLGPHHTDVLTVQIHLSQVYYEQGRLEKAKSLQEEVFHKRSMLFGPDHPMTISAHKILQKTALSIQEAAVE